MIGTTGLIRVPPPGAQVVDTLTLNPEPCAEFRSGPKRADVYLIFRFVRLTHWSVGAGGSPFRTRKSRLSGGDSPRDTDGGPYIGAAKLGGG
jgi:hypothetical protein